MLPKAESYASQGTCSVRKKKKKSKLYYSNKKALEKSRMRTVILEAQVNCLSLGTQTLLILQV
jgi:hypothetical protein